MKKSLRLERKPRESGLCEPERRGALFPPGKTTLDGGVLGVLHFGAIVLNEKFASRCSILSRREWMPSGADG
jgi:hypothetical protein